jgi:hypothetical protein
MNSVTTLMTSHNPAGMISSVNVEGSVIHWKESAPQITQALASNVCHLTEFKFAGVSGMRDVRLDALLTGQ